MVNRKFCLFYSVIFTILNDAEAMFQEALTNWQIFLQPFAKMKLVHSGIYAEMFCDKLRMVC